MKCDFCDDDANVHLTDVSNGEKKEVHLCEKCAKDQGTTIKSHLNKSDSEYPDFPAYELMTPQLEDEAGGQELVCPNCGISYSKFRSTGKFGCPDDYEVFGPHIVELMEKIHHKVQHTGKAPENFDAELDRVELVKDLRTELDKAIELENYERAAELRDKIYSLEAGSGKSRQP